MTIYLENEVLWLQTWQVKQQCHDLGHHKEVTPGSCGYGEETFFVSTPNASDCLWAFFGDLCKVCYLDDGIEEMQIHITELSGRVGSLVVHLDISRILMTMSTAMFDTCTAWPGA